MWKKDITMNIKIKLMHSFVIRDMKKIQLRKIEIQAFL